MNIIGGGDQLYFISCSFWLCLDAIRDRETSIIIWPFFIVVNAKIRPNNYFSGIYDVISYDVTLALSFKNLDQGNFGRTKFWMVVAKIFFSLKKFQFCHKENSEEWATHVLRRRSWNNLSKEFLRGNYIFLKKFETHQECFEQYTHIK